MSSLTSNHLLTKKEIHSYTRNGFVVPKFRLDNSDLEKLQNATLELMQTYPNIPAKGLVSPHIFYAGFNCPVIHSKFLEICKLAPLIDIVDQLIGADIIVWGRRISSKAPQTERATPWHPDGEYWPIRPLSSATVWIPIDESNENNGCLKIFTGCNRAKILLPHQS